MNAARALLGRRPWRRVTWLALVALLALAAGCGGGGSGGGVDTGGTGAPVQSFATGRIAGFGSIVVNGVHYEDASATIVDDEGRRHGRDALQLGMTVQVEAGPVERDPDPEADVLRAVASRIVFGSEIVGPVESVDAAASRLRVLGQAVKVDANTVFAGFASVAAIRAGDRVEVFAFFDPASGTYTATRLEREAAPAAFKLRGPIASLDTAARTFVIGAATISYAGLPADALPGLRNGVLARVELQTAPVAGRWIATRIGTPLPGAAAEGARTELEGFITDFASRARFTVDGVVVDASGAGVVFDKGSAAQLVDGARIEVTGRMQGGVLVAERIEVRRAKDADDSGGPSGDDTQQFELRGPIQSADPGARSFVVRDTAVTFDAATRFDKGTASDLRAGAVVRVKGTLVGGNQVRADRIRFDK